MAPAATPAPAPAAPRTGPLEGWFANLARRPSADAAGVVRIEGRYIYILPTGTGYLLGLVLMLMLLGSLNYQNNLALLFTFAIGSIATVAMFHTWLNLLDLRVAAQGGPPVFAGKDAVFSFAMEDDRARERGDLNVLIGDRQAALEHLERAGARSVSIAVGTKHRGWLVADRVRLETRYPLGLFRAWSYPMTGARVLVYPSPAPRGPTPRPVPTLKGSDQGDLGEGADDFVGPRGYRPGDSPRRLDWKALARERGLVVKQFGGDRAAQVWIDWDRLPPVDTELRLSLLCRQVLDAAEQGLSYGLRLPGTTLAVGHGEIQKHRCLAALAGFGHG